MKWPDKNLLLALVLAIGNLLANLLIFGLAPDNEVKGLRYMVYWLEGQEKFLSVLWYQVFRPLAPILAVPFALMTDAKTGLLIITIIAYLLSACLIFKITDLIYEDKKQALFASLLWSFAVVALRHSLSAHTTDAGSWFFCIFSVYLILLYFENRRERLLVWSGLIAGLGMLMKESGGLGVLFFLMMMFLAAGFSRREKILKLAKFGVIFLLPIVAWRLYIYLITPFSQLYFLVSDITSYVASKASMADLVIFYILQHGLALFATFGLLGWLLILFGAFKEWQNKNRERIKILLALVPFSLVSWLWVTGDSRHAFIIGTLGALLGSYGLVSLGRMIKNKKAALTLTILIIFLYIVFNYSAYYFNDCLPFIDYNDIHYFFTNSLMD